MIPCDPLSRVSGAQQRVLCVLPQGERQSVVPRDTQAKVPVGRAAPITIRPLGAQRAAASLPPDHGIFMLGGAASGLGKSPRRERTEYEDSSIVAAICPSPSESQVRALPSY
jgi:hypothetical protein